MEMKDRFGDRLEAASYESDGQCHLYLLPDPRDERSKSIEGWISKRLLGRLRHLGQAYELPLLRRLPNSGAQIYPEVQLRELEEELAFLFSFVSDDALLKATSPMREMIRGAAHDPRGWVLQVEGP
jgi:hypothetical protein